MMLLALLRSRPRRIVAAVLVLLATMFFVGAAGLALGGAGGTRSVLILVAAGMLLAGVALAHAALRAARELQRLRAAELEPAEAMARGEERLQLLSENARDVIYRYRLLPTRGFEYVGPAVTDITGYTPEEHYADPDLGFEMVHPDDRHILEDSLRSPVSSPLVLRWRRKDGTTVWIEQRNKPIYNGAGELVAVEGIARDITRSKETEETLRRAVGRLNSVLASITDGYIALDEDGRFLEINRVAEEKVFGCPARELIGKKFHEEHPRAAEFHERCHAALAENRTARFEAWFGVLDRWYEVHAYPMEGRLDVYLKDITERKRIEEALRDSEERLRLALEAASLGLWDQDLETDEFVSTERAAAMHGLPPDAPLDPEKALAAVHPEDRDRVAEQVRHAIGTRGSYEAEYRVVGPDGTVRWVASRARVYEDGGGRLIGVVQDVTRRKRTEQSLLLQAQLLDQVQAAVIATDMDGKVIHWNRHAEKLYGWSREEALGTNIAELTVGPAEAGVAAEIMAQLRSGRSWEGEFTTRRKDGTSFPAHVSDTLVRDEHGNPTGLVGVSVDMTGRKRVEDGLRESEERFRAAFGSAATGMALASPEGRWLQVNSALCEITGYSEEELLGTDFQSITHPDDLEMDLEGTRRLLAGEVRYHYAEKRYLHKTAGRVVWALLSASLVRDANGDPLYFVTQVQDITESKRDKENLERLGRQNELILKSAGEGIYGLDLQEKTTFVNPAAEKMLGYEAGELVGRHQHDIIQHFHPDGTPCPPDDCPIYAALRDGDVHVSSDEVFWRKDGTSFPVEYVSTPIRQEGEVIGAVVTFSDITERKRAEESMRESEERFRLLAENTSDLVCLHEPDGRYLYVSPSCRRLLGYDPEALIGADPYTLFHPDDAERIRADSHDRILEGKATAPITFRIRKKSGDYVWFETTTEPILDDEGEIIRLQTASRDVTGRKRVEDALHESEERLRMALGVSPVVLFRQDRDLRYTWVHNPQLGFDADATIGRTDLDLLPREDAERLTEIKNRAIETGAGSRQEVRIAAGGAFYYDLTVEPLRDAAGRVVGLSGVAVDITERKRAEEAVAEAIRMKTDFLAEVSHELRTPLTVIRGNAEVGLDLKRGCVHEEILAEIVKEAATMSRMVEDLLFLARSDSSTPIFRPQSVCTQTFLTALAGRAALVIQERGATLAMDLSGAGQLRIDPMRVEQAVLALVDNAAKYGQDLVTLTSSTENGELRITVADNGPGIPEEHLPHVFERFYRVDHTYEQSGAGLGLSIAATITEAHGGRMEAESRPGKGTRISLYLPLPKPRPNDEAREPLAGETGR